MADIKNPRNTVLALADAVAGAFPFLNGRVVPVSLTEPDKQTMPDLPLAVVAIDSIQFDSSPRSNRQPIQIEKIVLEFWLKPERYPLADNRESALWAFYDYQARIDEVLAFLEGWESPFKVPVDCIGMEQSADDYAVYLSFNLVHRFKYCPPVQRPPDTTVKVVSQRQLWAPSCCTCTPIVANCPTCNIPAWRP